LTSVICWYFDKNLLFNGYNVILEVSLKHVIQHRDTTSRFVFLSLLSRFLVTQLSGILIGLSRKNDEANNDVTQTMDIIILHKYFFQYDLSVFFKINRDVCTHKRRLHTQCTTDIYMCVYFALCIFAFNLFVMGNSNAWLLILCECIN